MLTPGQAHDLACAEPLIDNADPDALLADKAYDANSFIDTLTQRGITPVSYTHLDVYKRQGPTHAALWIARRPMGADQGFFARP